MRRMVVEFHHPIHHPCRGWVAVADVFITGLNGMGKTGQCSRHFLNLFAMIAQTSPRVIHDIGIIIRVGRGSPQELHTSYAPTTVTPMLVSPRRRARCGGRRGTIPGACRVGSYPVLKLDGFRPVHVALGNDPNCADLTRRFDGVAPRIFAVSPPRLVRRTMAHHLDQRSEPGDP